MTNLSLFFGLLLILCSVVLNARRPDGISIHQDELVVTVYNGQFSVCRGDFSKNRDYYLKVTVGKQHRKTSIVGHSNDMPHWNENLYLNAGPGEHEMLVELFDHNTITPDNCLGHLRVKISEIQCSQDVFIDHHNFIGKKGDLIGNIRLGIKRNPAKDEHHDDRINEIDAGPNCVQDDSRPQGIDVVTFPHHHNDDLECNEVVSNGDIEIAIVEGHLYTKRGDLFGKPEYYLRASIGGKVFSKTKFVQRTRIQDKDDEEICDWNELFSLNSGHIGQDLLIQLMDHDLITQDDCIGELKINLRNIECTDAYHNIYDAHNETIGFVRIIISRKGIDACIPREFNDHENIDRLDVHDDRDRLDQHVNRDRLDQHDDRDRHDQHDDRDSKYNLVISILEAEVFTKKGDWLTKPDLYVKVSVGKHSWKTTCKEAINKRSRVVHNSDCVPRWDEKLYMNFGRRHREVLVELMDHDTFTKDDCLGSFTIDIDDISNHDGPIDEREFLDKHGKPIGRLLLGCKLN